MDSIYENNLTSKLKQATSNDEISSLTNGFNHMLTRLDEAFERQKRFTANAAHELKTPLAIIKTGAQVLNADKNAVIDDYRENGQTTITSVNRLSKIVDDLLLLASAGESVGAITEEIMLEPLFEAVESEIEQQLSTKNISINFDCGDICISSCFMFIYRAFFNLIENACKYGNENGNIEVKALKKSDFVYIIISDNAHG